MLVLQSRPALRLGTYNMSALLNIPYKSQYDSDASDFRNDCGPTCLAMILAALGHDAATNAVFRRTGAEADAYVTMGQLMRAGESYGAPLEYRKNWSLEALKATLAVGQPVIALVHYGSWSQLSPGVSTQSAFTGPHFVLTVGFDEDSIYVHDPLYTGERRAQGAHKEYSSALFMDAWGRAHEDSDLNGNPNPDRAALVCTRLVGRTGAAVNDPLLLRRVRAKAAWDGQPLPELSHLTSLNSYVLALGNWGRRTATHIVGPSDTMWNLAQAYYGDGRRYRAIALFNGLSESDVIHDGDALLIPEPARAPRWDGDGQPQGSVAAPAHGGPRPPRLAVAISRRGNRIAPPGTLRA